MPKQYQLLSSEPITEFDEFVLRLLRDTADLNGKPRAVVGAVLTDADEVVTYYHNATMQDMMVAKSYLELDIVNDNILGNLPWFVDQAVKDGLIGDEGDAEDWNEEENDDL